MTTGPLPPQPSVDPQVAAGSIITTGEAVLGGGAWKVLSTSLPQVYVLVVSIVAARILGPAAFGHQSFIAFVELSLISLLAGGLPLALMRQIGESVGLGRPGAVRTLVRWAWRLELVGALAGAAVLVSAGLAGANPRAAWLLAAVVCAFSVLHTIPSSVLIGLQRWRQATVAGLVSGAIGTVATVTVLSLGGGIVGMFAVEAVGSAVILVWTATLARASLREVSPQAAPAADLRRRTTRIALLASIAVVLELIVWKRSEFFLLQAFSTDSELAFYSIAFAVVMSVVRVSGTLAGVLAPAVANLLGAGDLARIRSGLTRAMRLLMLLTLPLVALGAALGPAAIGIVWGDEFKAARTPFLIMAVASLLFPVSDISYALFVGLGRLSVKLVGDGLAALVNIGLALALIPSHGATGAALANSGAQLAAGLTVVLYARRVLGGIPWRPVLLLPAVLASAAAGAAGWAVQSQLGGVPGLVAGLLAALVVFAALGALLPVIPREDAAWLTRAVQTRGAGPVQWLCRHFSGRLMR